MYELFLDVLLDSVSMIPLLLIVYIGIELVEYKFGNLIRKKVQGAGAAGPAIGALAGGFPQCGFSVVGAALYSQRLVTIGTLLAVFLSTSDEAIPVILSQPDKIGIILPLILTKIAVAIIAGYTVDFFFRKKNKFTLEHIEAYTHGHDDSHHNHDSVVDEIACCGHSPSSESKKFNPREIIWHPIKHTAKIFSYIFGASLLLNLIIFQVGQATFEKLFLGQSFWQPFLTALIGLIPNCIASVTITQMYMSHAITFGSVIAGLSASGGLGILVLFREEKNKKDVLKIMGLLYGISVIAGLIIQYVFKM
ncbi:arsenic efflux protein [Candidatus Parcubacteria bacterium]|nr:arsenic efflux protein [Patescibacteria group bacterium]MBU4309098.1 arsenic efflux protein [Patescibacteria group bacterium]MBU4431944.1 arsenic efflux protein [Patescibacteria group bacterium]MBU4577459.1 arsenic efflux protein [Patescibacteria group bacterium]MCG2697147.1 arsenic efflux protein [Candidatus Parcubacteria bacterium]